MRYRPPLVAKSQKGGRGRQGRCAELVHRRARRKSDEGEPRYHSRYLERAMSSRECAQGRGVLDFAFASQRFTRADSGLNLRKTRYQARSAFLT